MVHFRGDRKLRSWTAPVPPRPAPLLTDRNRGASLGRDGALLIGARVLRMLGIGVIVPSLPLYLSDLRLGAVAVGAVLTAGMLGGAVSTAGFGVLARRLGRRRSLQLAALLPLVGAALLLTQHQVAPLAVAAFVGGVSASGQDVGAPQALEQAVIADLLGHGAGGFARFGLAGSLSLALGSLLAGLLAGPGHLSHAGPYVVLIGAYAGCSLLAGVAYSLLGPAVEGPAPEPAPDRARPVLGRSRRWVTELALLYSVDALAGGVGAQSLVAYYFHLRFGVGLAVVGPVLFLANLAAAGSQLVAAALANRFGLLRTMVFTHLPSNILLASVPLMPSWPLAAAVLVCRQSISQMDVPTRQAYTMAVVAPEQRAAAAGLTGGARTAAAAAGPLLGGALVTPVMLGFNLVAAGAVKAAYDLALYRRFRHVPLPMPAAAPGPLRGGPPPAAEDREGQVPR